MLFMLVQDRYLICRDCSTSFLFSAGEQEFFLTKGLKNEPKRCPNCRLVTRAQRKGSDVSQLGQVACADCGSMTKVPFIPKGYRPVYCVSCYVVRRDNGELVADHDDKSQAYAAG